MATSARSMPFLMRKLLSEHIAPYEGILRFVVAMLAANWFWKLTVIGDEEGISPVTWFGLDLTWYFDMLCDHVAGAVYALLRCLGEQVTLTNGNIIRFTETRVGTSIIWGCTGVKQSFIWLVILLAARGQWKDKLWYIPVGWLCAYLFNIFRIFMVALLTKNHPEWFEFLHTFLFKYLFYGMFFCLWLIYDLYIVKPKNSPAANNA